ncbi:hypothetical protein PWT90_03080 [Aphanocladium album]|nr:hypothetical protein PWT90_03080 [Aphanocladium album]
MSYAVAKPQASSPAGHDGPPSSATVYDFICLFTHDLKRKQKRWQDGKLKYHSFNKKIMVYDDRGHFVGDAHWDQEGDLATGDELSLDRGMALVQVDECTGEKQQDLTDLLDKRAREVEKRRQIAAAKTRPTPRSSLAGGVQPQPPPPPQHQQQRPLSALVQSPARIGRASIPAHSPYEARQSKLHQNQPPVGDAQPTVPERAPPAKRRRTSPSPPSKAGHARSLFGATLNLSSCPGPELMAARARALRARMQSQAEASATPQEDEDSEAQQPVQSSPLFVQDRPEATPSKPVKEQRSTLQPVTRHPIASARAVMRDAEEVGNRDVEMQIADDEDGQQENAPKRQRKEAKKPERRPVALKDTVNDVDAEDAPLVSEKALKRKKDKEFSKSRHSRETEDEPHEIRNKKPAAARRSPSPEPMVIDDEPEAVEEAPRPRKTTKESRQKKKARDQIQQELAPVYEAPKPKEPRTTLRMRSRQKRGLLMMRQPVAPLPEPQEPVEEVDDRVAKTPTPEPSPPPFLRSPSPPEELIIPSSAPPVDTISERAPSEAAPNPALAESSSDDDLPQPLKRRATKRRTYSPSPEPQAPKKKTKRIPAKRVVSDDEASEAMEEPQPQKRRASKRTTYTEEPESEHDDEKDEEEPEPEPEPLGPRIARLPRKGIRSREIIGFIPQDIDSLIPGPFASAFRLGGPPVPVREAPAQPAEPTTVEAPSRLPCPLPAESAAAVSSPVEEKPVVSLPIVPEEAVPEEALPEVALAEPVSDPVPAAAEEAVIATEKSPPLPTPLRAAIAGAEKETTRPEPASRRNVTAAAPPPVVRSASSNDAVAATTREANGTKLEALSAPEIPLAQVPEHSTAQITNTPLSDSDRKPDVLLEAAVAVPMQAVPMSASSSSGGEPNQAARPRIANPASRGKKAARREDAAGLAPQVIVPFEPIQPVTARMIATRPAGAGGRGRIAAAGPLAIIAGAPAAPAVSAAASVVARKAASTNMPGFTSASGGTWSRHAHDLLGMSRPERRR